MNSYVIDEFRMKIAKIPPKDLGKEEGEEADIWGWTISWLSTSSLNRAWIFLTISLQFHQFKEWESTYIYARLTLSPGWRWRNDFICRELKIISPIKAVVLFLVEVYIFLIIHHIDKETELASERLMRQISQDWINTVDGKESSAIRTGCSTDWLLSGSIRVSLFLEFLEFKQYWTQSLVFIISLLVNMTYSHKPSSRVKIVCREDTIVRLCWGRKILSLIAFI